MNRSFRTDDNSSNSFIPSYSGTNGAVATHSNLSSMTAYSILNDDKGNAFDAAAGAMLVEGLVNPQMFGMGGEGVMILKPKDQNPLVLNGNTLSPRKFDFLNLVTRGYTEVPDQGILSAGVPAAFSSIFRMLQRYGSLDFKTIFDTRESEATSGSLKMPSRATLYVLDGNINEQTKEIENAYLRYVIYIPFATPESTGLPTKPSTPSEPWILSLIHI